jgi:HK97 gp10 family phage protein
MIGAKMVTTGLNAALDNLLEKVQGEALKAGVAAAAKEFYDEALVRVPVNTGKLKSAIYRVYSASNSGEGKQTYHISWNKSKAPHGHLVEFGTKRAPANPFLAPAYEAAKGTAADAARNKLKELL